MRAPSATKTTWKSRTSPPPGRGAGVRASVFSKPKFAAQTPHLRPLLRRCHTEQGGTYPSPRYKTEFDHLNDYLNSLPPTIP
jgi:hypothetical protein